jgi:hypothetical protein
VPVTDGADLYGLPLEQFIAERALLAKALRAERLRDKAAAITALRKPSVAAWAVNQLVRTRSAETLKLFAAGDELQQLQADLLEGTGDPAALRAATEPVRAAVDELVALATGLLSSDGHELTPATLERVADTLHAAALDPDARALVADGRLERELRYAGLGGGLALALPQTPASKPATARKQPAPDAPPTPATPAPPADTRAREKELREELARIERERAERIKLARHAESDARDELDLAERALAAARRRRDIAADALREADEALAAVLRRVAHAGDAHRRSAAELERAEAD